MRVLSIGSDRKLWEPGSEVAERVVAYGAATDELAVIVLTRQSLGHARRSLSPQVTLYPTNSRTRWLYWWDAWRLGRRLGRFDVVTAQDPFESGLAAWLVACGQAKLQLQLHTDVLSPYFWRESLLNKIRVCLALWLVPRADGIRVVSQRIKDSLVARLDIAPDKITVLPVFVDIEKWRAAPVTVDLHQKYRQFKKIILMASRLTREKNILLALDALRALGRSEVGLIIVGAGPEERALKAEAARLGLARQVMFEMWTDNLASYYKTADVFLNTSWYEGYGRTLVEATAAGCPVISTDVGVARETAAQIADFAPAALARALKEQLSL